MTRTEQVKRRILLDSDMDYAGICPSAVLEDEPRGAFCRLYFLFLFMPMLSIWIWNFFLRPSMVSGVRRLGS